ncbi:MAG: sulfatase [Planctomycetota bacterium]
MTRLILACSILLSLFVCSAAPAQQHTQPTPNIVFFLVDDYGWMDTGYGGSSFYQTPNIDKLAASGMVFTNAYAACPVCSPTRVSIMSGKHPARLDTTDFFGALQGSGVRRMIAEGRDNRWTRQPLIPADYVPQLPLDEVSLAEAFKAEGYATFFAGKWHLGGTGFGPTKQGFDINIGGTRGGGPYGGGKYFHPLNYLPNMTSEPGDHLPDRLARETSKFITEHKDGPFLAYLSFYSVHTPLMGRPDLVEKYKQIRSQMEIDDEVWGVEGARKVRLVQEHAVYAAMVEAMDQAVGDVLDTLEEQGLADNTVVVFFSDNGGLSTSEGHPTSNLPLRAGKGWLYEGGVREPCIVRWPGRTEPGSSTAVPIISNDFYPTLLDMTGLAAMPEQHVDGTSFASILTGEVEDHRRGPLFWHYPHYGNQGGSPGGAIRLGDWKLIEWYTPGRPLELYNLAEDIGETNNLAEANPERAQELHALLQAWRDEVDAKMPEVNPRAQ